MIIRKTGARRPAAAAVETAFVMIPLIMMIMGVFEYGRLLMDWNLLNNAAREGCRYALVNNTAATLSTDVTNLVTTYMGKEAGSFNSFTVTVSGTHAGASAVVSDLAPGDMIMVTVSGQYKFMNIIPLVSMPSLTITSAVTMICEGGT